MTRKETKAILSICQAEWPGEFRGMDEKAAAAKLNLWAELFADDDPALVGAALKTIIVAGNREFCPKIGTIKEQMRRLAAPDELNEAEAWAKVRRAVSNGIYGAREEFERLPPELQKIVGSPSQLRDWAMLPADELHTVVASNVQRAYRTMRQREAERQKLPEDVRALLSAWRGGGPPKQIQQRGG